MHTGLSRGHTKGNSVHSLVSAGRKMWAGSCCRWPPGSSYAWMEPRTSPVAPWSPLLHPLCHLPTSPAATHLRSVRSRAGRIPAHTAFWGEADRARMGQDPGEPSPSFLPLKTPPAPYSQPSPPAGWAPAAPLCPGGRGPPARSWSHCWPRLAPGHGHRARSPPGCWPRRALQAGSLLAGRLRHGDGGAKPPLAPTAGPWVLGLQSWPLPGGAGGVLSPSHLSSSPSPKCATGSISHRYPEPPSMMRRWAPLRRVNSTTLAPRAKAPKRVRGMTRSQLLAVPCEGWRGRG